MMENRRTGLESALQVLQDEVDGCLPATVFCLPDRNPRDRVAPP